MNKLVYLSWHLLAGIFIFGMGGICFTSIKNNPPMYFGTVVFMLLCILGVLLLSLCTVETKKDQQR